MLVMLNRGDYWQCAFVIPKGSIDAGQGAWPRRISRHRRRYGAVRCRDRLGEIKSWDDVKLLTVAVDRLRRWYRPGLICIGDAAHAMSPIGGVGINLAMQDAVAAANILAEPLRARRGDGGHARRRSAAPRRSRRASRKRLQLTLQNNVHRPGAARHRPPEGAAGDEDAAVAAAAAHPGAHHGDRRAAGAHPHAGSGIFVKSRNLSLIAAQAGIEDCN